MGDSSTRVMTYCMNDSAMNASKEEFNPFESFDIDKILTKMHEIGSSTDNQQLALTDKPITMEYLADIVSARMIQKSAI